MVNNIKAMIFHSFFYVQIKFINQIIKIMFIKMNQIINLSKLVLFNFHQNNQNKNEQIGNKNQNNHKKIKIYIFDKIFNFFILNFIFINSHIFIQIIHIIK